MTSERATELANRLGLTSGVSAVAAKSAEAAGLITTGGPTLSPADWAIIVSIIGGVLYIADRALALYERIRRIRGEVAASAED